MDLHPAERCRAMRDVFKPEATTPAPQLKRTHHALSLVLFWQVWVVVAAAKAAHGPCAAGGSVRLPTL